MVADYRHAGMGWPTGAVDNARILALPSPDLLMLATEGRYHHDAAVRAGKRVLWRAVPRVGKRPAELRYVAGRFAAEVMNLTDEAASPISEMIPWNELDLNSERGDSQDDWKELGLRYSLLGQFQLGVILELRIRLPGVVLHYGAWTPDHDAIGHIHHWIAAAQACDVVDFHAYDTLDKIRTQYETYRAAFPDKRLFLAEWHGKGDLDEERRILQWLAETAEADPLFDGAAFFIWNWPGAPGGWSRQYDVEHNPAREALFLNPPAVTLPGPIPEPEPEPTPMPEKPNPWEHWSAERIARDAGCPIESVTEHWPRLVEQLAHCGINDRAVQTAMIGTVAIESASTFSPVREAFWLDEEWRRVNLRYYPFYGRGFIQLTWESNYAAYGPKIAALWGAGGHEPDFDLVGDPDRALNPDISAAVAALYFRDHGGGAIPVAARAGDWREVRRLVQGADAGLDRLVAIAAALGGTPPPVATERMYSADIPDSVVRQQNSWTCAVRATYAALWAMAQQGHGPAVTYGDGGPRDVYNWLVPKWDGPNVGLLDHTGAGLAEALRSHGYAARNYYPVSLEDVRALAGGQPVLIGGDSWNHWVMVRGRTNDAGLILENPLPGHAGINDYLRDSWGRLGPMAAVVIDLVPVVEPPPPVDVEMLKTLVGTAFNEDGVVVPALAAALANPDDVNLRMQTDAVVRWLRANRPPAA